MIKYINAAQAQVINVGIGGEVWENLNKFGHVQGGGVYQEKDGELTIHAFFLKGTLVGNPPDSYKGFRIICEERGKAIAL